jgi:hypothetical protein
VAHTLHHFRGMSRRIPLAVAALALLSPAAAVADNTVDAHHLRPTDWCVGDDGLPDAEQAECAMAEQTDPPDKDGYAAFTSPFAAKPIFSKRFYKTHVATKAELVPGVLVVHDRNATYDDRDGALRATWRFARFAGRWDPDSGEPCFRSLCLPVHALRVVEGQAVKPVKLASKPDRHHYHAEEWFVYDDDFGRSPAPEDPEAPRALYPALALRLPTKADPDGDFLLYTSRRITTRHAVRLRPANKDDVAVGRLAAVASVIDARISDGPASVDAARAEVWLLAPIDKIETEGDTTYALVGGRKSRIAALRVVITK